MPQTIEAINISTTIRAFAKSMLSLLDQIEAEKKLNLQFPVLKEALQQIYSLSPATHTKGYLHDFFNLVKILEPPINDASGVPQWKTLYDNAINFANEENAKLAKQESMLQTAFLDIHNLFDRTLLTFPKHLITWGDGVLNCKQPKLIEDIDGNFTHTFRQFAHFDIRHIYIAAIDESNIPIEPKSISRKLSRINAGDCILIEIIFKLENTELDNINLAKALSCFNNNNTGCYTFEENGPDKKISFYIKSTESTGNALKLNFGETVHQRLHKRLLEIKKSKFMDRELVLITQLDLEPNHNHNYDAGMVYFSKDRKQILIANGKVDVHMRCALNIASCLNVSIEDAKELALPIWKQTGIRYKAYHNGMYGIPNVHNKNEVKTILMAIGVPAKDIMFIAA